MRDSIYHEQAKKKTHMTEDLIINCCKTDAQLTLTELVLGRKEGYVFFSYHASLSSLHLKAKVKVEDATPKGWIEFFAELAKNWKGWKGQKKIDSLEGNLSIQCETDSLGHVTLKATLRDVYDTWLAEQQLQLEAGQLEELSKRSKAFFTNK